MCQEHYWSISFFIFWKYGLNYTRKSKFWLSYACCCLEIMAQNHKNLDFHQTLRLHISHGYHLQSLAHTFFWFFGKPFGGTNTLWSKNHVPARAWDRVITQNSIFIQKLLCNAAHNGSSLRSGAKSKYSIVSSNMILSSKRN